MYHGAWYEVSPVRVLTALSGNSLHNLPSLSTVRRLTRLTHASVGRPTDVCWTSVKAFRKTLLERDEQKWKMTFVTSGFLPPPSPQM